MNGLHDLGGMNGFGPIRRDEHEPLFHEDWERRTFALLIAVIASGAINMDEARDGVERMDPLLYLQTVHADESYYWRWLCATEILLERKGIVTRAERDARISALLAEEDASCRV
jgi:nitrile hydratase subunit beta